MFGTTFPLLALIMSHNSAEKDFTVIERYFIVRIGILTEHCDLMGAARKQSGSGLSTKSYLHASSDGLVAQSVQRLSRAPRL